MTKRDLQLPDSREEIAAIQSKRKKVAVKKAKLAKYYGGKLDSIDTNNLDEPEEWAKIPITDKETLREVGVANFEDQFCIGSRSEIAEYWRSGGATGVPLYYPRTHQDMDYTYLQLCRCWAISGA